MVWRNCCDVNALRRHDDFCCCYVRAVVMPLARLIFRWRGFYAVGAADMPLDLLLRNSHTRRVNVESFFSLGDHNSLSL